MQDIRDGDLVRLVSVKLRIPSCSLEPGSIHRILKSFLVNGTRYVELESHKCGYFLANRFEPLSPVEQFLVEGEHAT